MFVERGLVTAEQLQGALEIQQRTGERLGEVLVAHFGVSRLELASVLAEQWEGIESGGSSEPVETPAVPVPTPVEHADEGVEAAERRPIGEIFVEQGFVTAEELERALVTQRETGQRLGEALVSQGSITRLELASALADQWAMLQKLRPPASQPPDQNGAPTSAEDAPSAEATANPEMTTRVDDLATRVQALSDLQIVRTSLAERVEELALRVHSIGTLDGDLQAMRTRLDELASRSPADAEARAQLDELSARVHALAVAPAGRADEELATRLVELERRIAAAAGSKDVREAFDAVRAELSSVAEQLEDLPSLSAVERRIDSVEARLSDGTEQHKLRTAIADLQAEVAALGGRDERGRIDRLVDRLDAVEKSLPAPAVLNALRDDVARLASRPEVDPGQVEDLASRLRALDDVGQLRARLDELAERPAGDPALTWRVEELAARIDELGSAPAVHVDETLAPRLEEVESRLAAAAAAQDVREGFEAVRDEMREVAARLEDVSSPPDLSGEVEALRASLAKLAAIPAVQVDETLAPRLEEVESRLAAAAASQDVRDGFEAVRDEMREVAARLEDLSSQPDVTGQVEALHASLAELAQRPPADPALAARLEELAARVDELGSAPAVELDETLAPRLDEVERRLAAAVASQDVGEELEALRHELREVAARLQNVTSQPELSGEVEALRASLAELAQRPAGDPGLAARVEEIDARLDAAGALAGQLEALRASVDEPATAPPSSDESLVARLGELERRLGDAAVTDEVRAAFDAVRGDVRNIAARLEDVSSQPDRSGDVESLRAWMVELAERPAGDPGLDARVAALAARVEQTRVLGGELEALRSRVDDLAAAPSAQEQLAPRLDEVEHRLATIELPDVAPLHQRLAGVEARLAGAAELRAEIEAVRGQLAEAHHVSAEDLERLSNRIDGVEHGLADSAALDAVWAKLDAVAARPQADPSLPARVGELAAWIEELAGDAARSGEVAALRDAVSELESRLVVDPGLDERIGALSQRLDEVTASAASRHELAGLAGAVARLEARPVADPDLPARLGELHHRIDSLEPTSLRVDELVSRVEELSARTVADPALGERVEELDGRLAASLDLAGAAVDRIDDQLAALRTGTDEVAAAAGRGLEELDAALRERLDAVASEARSAVERSSDELGSRLDHLSQELRDELTGSIERAAAAARGEQKRLGERIDALARQEAVDAGARTEIAGLRQTLAALGSSLDELAEARAHDAEQVAMTGAELGARIDDLAVHVSEGQRESEQTLRAEVAGIASRLEESDAAGVVARDEIRAELERAAASVGWRLERVEEALASEDNEALRKIVGDLVQRLDGQEARQEEQVRVTERALRKGLASLGERLVDSEKAYVEAGNTLRRSIERLGSALVEADVATTERASTETLVLHHANSPSYVAFAPTAEGYRLVAVDSPVPAVGAHVELPQCEGELVVTRVGASPIPLDTRPCAYLERA
jgi:hypothetical protein